MAIRLVDSRLTLFFDGDHEGRPLKLEPFLSPRPWYVWKNGSALVASFQAEPVDPEPPLVPGKGVAALLGLLPSQILEMGEEGADLQALLADGAFVKGAALPRTAVACPGRTARYLCRCLTTLAYRAEWS